MVLTGTHAMLPCVCHVSVQCRALIMVLRILLVVIEAQDTNTIILLSFWHFRKNG